MTPYKHPARFVIGTAAAALSICAFAAPPDSDHEKAIKSLTRNIAKAVVTEGKGKKAAVVDFFVASPEGAAKRGNLGTLGSSLALISEEVVQKLSEGPFQNSLGATTAQAKLRKCNVDLEMLDGLQGSKAADAGKCFVDQTGVDTLITGKLIRNGDRIKIVLTALRLPGFERVASESDEVFNTLDLSQLAGDSVVAPYGATPEQKIDPSKLKNPFLENDNRYKIEILCGDKPLPLYRGETGEDKGKVFVPAEREQPYAIRLTNNTAKPVAVALLIDGINSITQSGTYEPGRTRKWVIDPKSSVVIKGYQQSKVSAREFVFTTAEESLAASQGTTDELGVISAAFFEERGAGKGIGGATAARMGTKAGEAIASKVQEVQFDPNDAPAVIMSIRYDSKDKVEKLPPL